MCVEGGRGRGLSSFSPVNAEARQGCVLVPSFFNTCMKCVVGRVVDLSHCGTSHGNTRVTDFIFADDVVILSESLEVLVMT